MKKTLFYLILLLLMVACKKTPSVDCDAPTNDLALCKELIIGKWAWAKNIQRFGGYKVSTPVTAGITRSLNFKTNGIVETYINGQLKDTSSYEIYDGNRYFKLDSGKTFLTFREEGYVDARSVILKICEDSLYLPYEALIYHTGNDYYSRVK
jgi:hypothetical protein